MKRHIIYLHGFNSSPQSEKARLTQSYFEDTDFEVHVPALPPAPNEAMHLVQSLVNALGEDQFVGFIGSSLGGYFSLYLHSRFNLPAVLINPAIRPYELLVDYLGENTNMYTGETYMVEAHHMDELKTFDVDVNPQSKDLYLLTQTHDEVLDYSQATQKLPGIRMWIQFGGDHAFQNFVGVLPSIEEFLSKFR